MAIGQMQGWNQEFVYIENEGFPKTFNQYSSSDYPIVGATIVSNFENALATKEPVVDTLYLLLQRGEDEEPYQVSGTYNKDN